MYCNFVPMLLKKSMHCNCADGVKWPDEILSASKCMFSYSPVQNGAVTQKDTLNDDEFEPYLNTQARQVRNDHRLILISVLF